jgi:hypothetical protein
MTSDRRSALLAAVAVLLVLGAFTLLRHRGDGAGPAAAAPSTHTTTPPTSSPEARRARDAMREQILEALRRRDAGAPPPRAPLARSAPDAPRPAAAPSPGDPADRGSYDPHYIQENVREQIFPLLASCYKEALSRNPKLAGKLVFSFRIVGDPSVGGVIEDAEFADGTEIKDAEMETCTRESMMSLSLDKPPSGGGYVTVTYPVAFAPGDDDDDDGGEPVDAGKR